MTTGSGTFPILRWVGLVWMALWLPVYLRYWSWENLLHLCDVSVFLSCAGFWWGSSLLVSSQAVASLAAGILWVFDIAWRLVSGRILIGGIEYMWDESVPLWVRLLSSFHIVLPIALFWAMKRIGYHRRAFLLQSAIAAGVLIVSRLFSPALNMNYVFQDPLFHRSWGPAPVHLAVIFAGAVVLIYWPTHLFLSRMLPAAGVAQ